MRTLILFITTLFCLETVAQLKNEQIIARNTSVVQASLDAAKIKSVDQIYLRAFKTDAQLEVWVLDNQTWKLFTTYPFCAKSGIPGRKRIRGDRQIPEGCYKITEFNLWSNYHLSMRINYPNEADYIWADSMNPGDDIFIHGGCITVGCIPITDKYIEQLWTLCKKVDKEIIVHIFSTRFDKAENMKRLETFIYTREDWEFQEEMKKVFFYFQNKRRIPLIKITEKGKYEIKD